MQHIHQTMGIQDCSSTNTTFMFPPPPPPSSSQIPLFLQHHNPPSSWTTFPQPLPLHHHHSTFNRLLPCPTGDHLPPPSSLSSHGGNLFKRVVEGLHVAYEGSCRTTSPSTHDRNLGFNREMVDAKAIAASKSHSEAERRRRERINNHLTKLRSLLPNTTKTDKASLLAEVIEHMKDLRSQTSMIAEQSAVPSETDELTIDNTSDEEGRMVIRASLCCEDRSDLLPDLIRTLKTLRLRTLKAEITTLGRRVKNVLFVTGDHHSSSSTYDDHQMVNRSINVIEEALKAIIEKTNDQNDSSFGSSKRQRTNKIDIFEQRT